MLDCSDIYLRKNRKFTDLRSGEIADEKVAIGYAGPSGKTPPVTKSHLTGK